MPAEGALTILDDMPVKAGGCAANVAIDLARLGVSVDVAGCVGLDPGADVLRRAFAAAEIGYSRVVGIEGLRTSKTIILLIEGQDRRYFHVVGANRALAVAHLPYAWLSSLKIFYLGGLGALPGMEFAKLAPVLEYCRQFGVMTVLDVVAPQDVRDIDMLPLVLPHVDVFVPNDDEARAFTGYTDPHDQLRTFQKAGAHTVIITQGGDGCVALHDGKTYRCGAFQMSVVDPSGSGDAFTAGIIASLRRGSDFATTLRLASAIGASATRAAGTTDSVFSAQEAQAFLEDHPLAVHEGL
jgi:sugar/nucleoside kinase (ribokinase family)